MPAMTVTVQQSGGAAFQLGIVVKVITGASGVGTVVQSSTTGALGVAVNPAGSGSRIYGALQVTQDSSTYPSTALASTTTIVDSVDTTGSFGAEEMVFRNANATVAGTPQTLGYDNTNRTSFYADLIMVELLNGGSIAEDASSPAAVPPSGNGNFTGSNTRTTASFTPPGGSLLIAMAVCKAKSAPIQTLSITDSQGLTWTQRAIVAVAGAGIVQCWTAPVPAGSVTITPATVMAATTIPMPAVITTTFGYSVVGTGTAATATTSSKSTDAATSGSLVGSNSDQYPHAWQ